MIANATIFAANPPFAVGVTMNGVGILNITNNAVTHYRPPAGSPETSPACWSRTTTTRLRPLRSVKPGQGLNTLLTNININNYAGTSDDVNTVILAAAAGDATKTIDIGINGNLGNTTAGGAAEIAISNDAGGGTSASPNLTYGTWAITAANNAFLQLEQGVTTGRLGDVRHRRRGWRRDRPHADGRARTIALGQAETGDWQLLQSIDASATTGAVIITGASAGLGTGNAFASAANPGWLFGSDAGFLDDTGTGGVFDLTAYKLGTGLNVLDVSSATAAQVAALTTTPAATVTPATRSS